VLELGGARFGRSVCLLGPGPRGLASVIAAKAAGAGPITVTGLASDRDRLDLALELGADHAVEVDPEHVVEQVNAATGGLAHDVVVDCTPLSLSSVTDAVNLVARKGTVVLAGVKGHGRNAPMPVDLFENKQVTMRGAVSRSMESMELAIRLLEAGGLPFERFASHAYGLAGAAEGVRSITSERKPMHVRIEPRA
jgi:threonine dehydrogenase-like Zn-dependent dehydrogenase